jgi:membrane peptidoglycan carboxypeptidase
VRRTFFIASAVLLAGSAVYGTVVSRSLPRVSTLSREPSAGLDWAPLDTLSDVLICAVVAAEDRSFFHHHGVDWVGARVALLEVPSRMLRGERIRGASTITQQLARTLYLSPQRSLDRKLREWLIARRLERALPKRRILELYLNSARWTSHHRGINAGAKEYFGKSAFILTPFESVLLASVLSAPGEPFGTPGFEQRTWTQRRALGQLHVAGIIDSTEMRAALVAVSALHSELRNESPPADAIAVARQMERLAGGANELGNSGPDAVMTQCRRARETESIDRLTATRKRE